MTNIGFYFKENEEDVVKETITEDDLDQEMAKYEEERKQLYYYCKNANNVNLEEWEEFLNYFEQKIKESV